MTTAGHPTPHHASSQPAWRPTRGDLVYDTGKRCIGVVVALPEDTGTTTYQLTPEGGGDGWTTARRRLAPPEAASAAVLYVCAERGKQVPTLAEERAVEEGHAFAGERDLRITAEVTDTFGEVDPGKRTGWQCVRGMAARREVTAVITRWPDAISTDHDLRHSEIAWCQEHAVRVLFSWAPLSAQGGEGG